MLIYQTRSIVREKLHDAGRILTIRGDYGYAYYPAVASGDHINPNGYRPIPNWDGDVVRVADLQELFTGFHYAVVEPDLQTATPLFTRFEYRYLVVLSHAYATGQGANIDKIILDTGISCNEMNVYRKYHKGFPQTINSWEMDD